MQAKQEEERRRDEDNQMTSRQLAIRVTLDVAQRHPNFALRTLLSHTRGPDVSNTQVRSYFFSLPLHCLGTLLFFAFPIEDSRDC